MAKISIIIPVRNRKHLTQQILEQIRSQTLDFAEDSKPKIIVIDDGSTDGTKELIKGLFSEVHLLEGDGSLWWGGAIVMGMKYAIETLDTNYIVWLNDDLKLAEDFIKQLIFICNSGQYPETIVGGIVRNKNYPDWLVYSGHINNKPLRNIGCFSRAEELEVDLIFGNIVVFSTTIVDKIGFPDAEWLPQNGCDHEYILRAKNGGFKIILSGRLQAFNDYTLSDVLRYMPYWMQWYLQPNWSKRWKIIRGLTSLKTTYNVWAVIKMHSKYRNTREIPQWKYALCYLSKLLKLATVDWMPKKYVYSRIISYLASEEIPENMIDEILKKS